MADLLAKVRRVLRAEPVEKAIRGVTYLSDNVWRKCWELRGGRLISIDETEIRICPSSHQEYLTLRYVEEHERVLLEDLLSELRPTDVCWDIGANIGVHSCLVGQRLSEGTVVAFEPYQPNVERLERNLVLNDLENVTVVDIALSKTTGTESLVHPKQDTPGDQWPAIVPNSSGSHFRSSKTSVSKVPTDTGDRLVASAELPRPTVVKIDVEGAAPLVISGMERTLSHPECRVVYCEAHFPANVSDSRPSSGDFGQEPKQLRRRFDELGFSTTVIDRREADFFIKAVADE